MNPRRALLLFALFALFALGTAPAVSARDDPPKALPIPARDALFGCRTGDAKTALLKTGATDDSEKAVARALAWLARQQTQDGSWVYDQGEKEYRAAATGMALLPFLAAGETHKPGKKGEERKYQKVVSNGLTALTKMCPKDGKTAGRISTNMYVQALATLALCEAYGMTRDADLKPFAQAAIDFLQTAQGPNGSWSYGANANGDLSIVGWQVQALHAAKLGGLEVNDAVIQKAVKFLNLAAGGPKKSMYGYNDSAGAAPGTSLTAVGLLCRYYLDDWQPDHAGLADGLAGLAKVPPVGQGNVRNMYYYYYATQVMRNAGGESWTNWNEGKLVDGARKSGLRDWLVAQQRKKDGADMGSWDPEGGWFGVSCGRLGTTAMCVLTLQVYYRSYPLYMPDAKGKLVKITDAK